MGCGELTGTGKSSETHSLVLEAREQTQAQESVAVFWGWPRALVGL